MYVQLWNVFVREELVHMREMVWIQTYVYKLKHDNSKKIPHSMYRYDVEYLCKYVNELRT